MSVNIVIFDNIRGIFHASRSLNTIDADQFSVMRKLKEILRLKYGCKLSHRQIAKSLSVSTTIVSRYACQSAVIWFNGIGHFDKG